jgi:hypothetical protein
VSRLPVDLEKLRFRPRETQPFDQPEADAAATVDGETDGLSSAISASSCTESADVHGPDRRPLAPPAGFAV